MRVLLSPTCVSFHLASESMKEQHSWVAVYRRDEGRSKSCHLSKVTHGQEAWLSALHIQHSAVKICTLVISGGQDEGWELCLNVGKSLKGSQRNWGYIEDEKARLKVLLPRQRMASRVGTFLASSTFWHCNTMLSSTKFTPEICTNEFQKSHKIVRLISL